MIKKGASITERRKNSKAKGLKHNQVEHLSYLTHYVMNSKNVYKIEQ